MINLKWNVDGTGFTHPDEKHLDFVEKKRDELYEIGNYTQGFVYWTTMAAAKLRGHGNWSTNKSIVKWQAAGTIFFVGAALVSKPGTEQDGTRSSFLPHGLDIMSFLVK